MQPTLADLAASGVSLFGQGSRLLKLRFPKSSGFDLETLLPQRLVGEEGLSVGYRYVLDCLCADTHLELKGLLGQPAEISLLLPDGGSRLLCGLVTHAAQAGADGGFAKYVLTLEPALAPCVTAATAASSRTRASPRSSLACSTNIFPATPPSPASSSTGTA